VALRSSDLPALSEYIRTIFGSVSDDLRPA
jgi:hypothetical protein